MDEQNPDRILYLAIPENIFYEVFEGVKGNILLKDGRLKVFGYATEEERIIAWKE